MDYLGPDAADLAHVHTLNAAFLGFLARCPDSRLQWSADLACLFEKASPMERARVARSPFLIYSLAGYDVHRWQQGVHGEPEMQLFDNQGPPAAAELAVVSATLAFLWPFVRRNPYAARVISGAPPAWCDALAGSTPLDAMRFASHSGGLLELRFRRNTGLWRKLLTAGISPEADVRSAARITALQTVLTRPAPGNQQRLAAACKVQAPASRVAEARTVSKPAQPRYNTAPHESIVNKGSRKDLRKR